MNRSMGFDSGTDDDSGKCYLCKRSLTEIWTPLYDVDDFHPCIVIIGTAYTRLPNMKKANGESKGNLCLRINMKKPRACLKR